MTTYNPFVSIALTTSKSKDFIKEQLDSLLNQTYKNLEVVISHDDFGDGTVEIVRDYQQRDPRVKFFMNTGPKGFIPNNENAIKQCTGEIIFLCDHDDYWYPEKVEEHVRVYENKDIQWVYNKVLITDGDNIKEIGLIENFMSDYYRHKTDLENAWGSCIGGAMGSYRKDVLMSALPIPAYAHAHDSWIQFFIYPKKSFFIDKVLQKYRQHAHNEVGFGIEKVRTKEEIFEKETLAIRGNFNFLKAASNEPRLPLARRIKYKIILVGKYLKYYKRLK